MTLKGPFDASNGTWIVARKLPCGSVGVVRAASPLLPSKIATWLSVTG